MTTLAPKPEWAPAIWTNKRGDAFIQFTDGNVIRFDKTEGGLAKVLKLCPCVEDQPGYVTGRSNLSDHKLKKPIKMSKATERKRMLQNAPEERRSKLADLISRRRELIKEEKK